jgi:membrane protein required for colicin V production
MTIYDVAMVGIVVAGMVWGAWRGITWQLASIASLVLGYSVAQPMSAQLAPQLEQFGGPVVARALAMILIYAAVSGGVFLVAWIVRSTLRQLKFEAFDRHLGMIMGGLEGALLGMIVTLFVVSLAPQSRAQIFTSPSGRIVGRVMNVVGPVLPGEVRQELAPFLNAPGGTIADGGAGDGIAPRDQALGDVRSWTDKRGPGETPTASKLQDLIEEGESRLGRAIVETAKKGLQPAGDANDRAVERR